MLKILLSAIFLLMPVTYSEQQISKEVLREKYKRE